MWLHQQTQNQNKTCCHSYLIQIYSYLLQTWWIAKLFFLSIYMSLCLQILGNVFRIDMTKMVEIEQLNKNWIRNSKQLISHFSVDCLFKCLQKALFSSFLNFSFMFAIFFFLIGIHSMRSWTATARHGVTRKKIFLLRFPENIGKKYQKNGM